MQIISGKYKGQKLCAGNIKPTMGLVKESLFNILEHGGLLCALKDAKVLDLFCGSGAMGIEALSRGAKQIFAIDMDTKSIETNINNLKLNRNYIHVVRADLNKLPKLHATGDFDVIFIDPPYENEQLLESTLLKVLTQNQWVKHGTIVIVEANKNTKLGEKIYECIGNKRYVLLREKKYGKVQLLFLCCNELMEEVKTILADAFPMADISITDLKNDGRHLRLDISAPDFAGKTKIQQHKLVYEPIKHWVGNRIHALQIKTQVKEPHN